MRNVVLLLVLFFFTSYNFIYGFTRISDYVTDGKQVVLKKRSEIRFQESNTTSSSGTTGPSSGNTSTGKKKSSVAKPQIVKAFHPNPTMVEFQIDNSTLFVRSSGDAQAFISNAGFYNAVLDAVDLFNDVDIANIMILPPKFSTGIVDPKDGINLISAMTVIPAESVSLNGDGRTVTIVTFAKNNNVILNGKTVMVKPGSIVDVDTIFDPANATCRIFFTSTGDMKIGGANANTSIDEGGADIVLAQKNCPGGITADDITNTSVQSLSKLLGLDTSAIPSSAISEVGISMVRYALTNDDKIGLANIYPNNTKIKSLGKFSGKVLRDKLPVIGAHIVLENTESGEPIAGTLTDVNGEFTIIAIPPGTYTVYAEPLDNAIRSKKFTPQTFFARNANTNFSTTLLDKPITISAGKESRAIINLNKTSALNINPKMVSLQTLEEVENAGGHAALPLTIRPGQMISGAEFWGVNIDPEFGTLSISGTGCTVSNVIAKSIRLSDEHKCQKCQDPSDPGGTPCNRHELCASDEEITEQADELPGISCNISCDSTVEPGPRTIVFTLDKLDETNLNFGLRDQITGGLIIRE